MQRRRSLVSLQFSFSFVTLSLSPNPHVFEQGDQSVVWSMQDPLNRTEVCLPPVYSLGLLRHLQFPQQLSGDLIRLGYVHPGGGGVHFDMHPMSPSIQEQDSRQEGENSSPFSYRLPPTKQERPGRALHVPVVASHSSPLWLSQTSRRLHDSPS